MRTTKFNMKDFGLRLRKLRQACGLTQEEFCDVIGISDTHYRKIEAGTRTGSLELIVETARELGDYIQIEGVYLGTLLKMVGITYIAEFASGICKDAGYSALGVQIEMFGKLSILAVSAPVLLALFETLQGLMG